MSISKTSWFGFAKPNPQAQMRLFCFPYAGGGAFEYRTWGNASSGALEVRPVQLPGREARLAEQPFTVLTELADCIAEQLEHFDNKPFAFFGHSLGAITCFEVARALKNRGQRVPSHLFVSASRAPHVPNPEPPVYHLPDQEMIDEVCERYDGIPKEVLAHKEMIELILPAMRADFTMSDTYLYHECEAFDFPITCFGADQDQSTPLDALEAWRDQTTADFSLKLFSGGHFFIRPHRAEIIEAINEKALQL